MIDGFNLPSPIGHAPVRRANSVRRTSSLDLTWPEGRYAGCQIAGKARDIHTPSDRTLFNVVRERQMQLGISVDRYILTASAATGAEIFDQLPGTRCNGDLRRKIQASLKEEHDQADPHYLLLDDVPVVLIVSEWAWSSQEAVMTEEDWSARRLHLESLAGVCTGFRPGSSALKADRDIRTKNKIELLPLRNPADPEGWHVLERIEATSMRRARSMDLWHEDAILHVECLFQDSATHPGGKRLGIHEYTVSAMIDAKRQTILSVEAVPHILPYLECPAATQNVSELVGQSVPELRRSVPTTLYRTAGCTHLNDTLRSLEDACLLAGLVLGGYRESPS